jgi:hypothetical protein
MTWVDEQRLGGVKGDEGPNGELVRGQAVVTDGPRNGGSTVGVRENE